MVAVREGRGLLEGVAHTDSRAAEGEKGKVVDTDRERERERKRNWQNSLLRFLPTKKIEAR